MQLNKNNYFIMNYNLKKNNNKKWAFSCVIGESE